MYANILLSFSFTYYAICSYLRISRLLTLTFSFLNLLFNFMKVSQYQKKEEKVLLTKNLVVANALLLDSYTVMYSYLDI